MRKIADKVIDLDIMTYCVYHREIEKGRFVFLHAFCSWIGLPFPLFTMLIIISAIGCWLKGPAAILVESSAYLFAALINLAIKALHKRTRPPNNKFWSPIPFDQYSFPSGHAAGTMAVAICLGIYIPILLFPLLIWATFIGISRFFGGYHHISDIVVGFLVGILSGLLLTNILLTRLF